MILTRWFTFAAPPKCGCLWFRQILRDQGIAVFGETEIPKVDGFELQKHRDSFRHHVPGHLPSITIHRDHEKWLRSYLHHFEGKRLAIECVDALLGDNEIIEKDVWRMFEAYKSTFTIDLDHYPHLHVIDIFRVLKIPHDAERIVELAPQNVTDFSHPKT